jgi:hypothetical protein
MATTAMTSPYSFIEFHKASDINDASTAFETAKGQDFVDKILATIIRKHNADKAFGPTLIHCHFDIEENEILVEFNNITTPWIIDDEFKETSVGSNGLVYPTIWLLDSNDKWMLYEFAFGPNGAEGKYIVDIDDPNHHDFLLEYTLAVKAGGWEKIIGLRAWPADGYVGSLEFTQGKADINLTPPEFSLEKADGMGMQFVETFWYFCKDFVEHPIFGRCVAFCQIGRHGGHVGRGHHRPPPPRPLGCKVPRPRP